MSEIELKPCPFCGKKIYSEDCGLHVDVNCRSTDCALSGVEISYIFEEQWNRLPIEDALRQRIAELESTQRWVPVEERMPESDLNVMLYCSGTKTSYVGYYDGIEWEYKSPHWQEKVTHWMPLPPMPEVEE